MKSQDEIIARKKIDFVCEMGEKVLLIEFKKNVDMVEKDLFKYFLFEGHKRLKYFNDKGKELQSKNFDTVLLIWEEENNIKNYKNLLDFSKGAGFLKQYFYFPARDKKMFNEMNNEFKKYL